MYVEIKRWDNEAIIVYGEYESISDCLTKNKDKSFYRANLRSANLSFADLRSADLSFADLSSANLSSADLRSADLSSANLSSANLSSADLNKLIISPPLFLMAYWGKVSDDLCLDLMRYDAFNHPHPEQFLEWSKNGDCPYSSINILRSANFKEKRELIKDNFLSLPVRSAYELMQAIIKEKGKQ